ncbi:MAG: type IV pilus biogenesis/stability protein PilW [Promethearchaeota archaeon]
MAILEVGINIGMKNLTEIKYYTSSYILLDPNLRAGFLTALESFSNEVFGDNITIISLASFKLVCYCEMITLKTRDGFNEQNLILYAIVDKETDTEIISALLKIIFSLFLDRFSLNDIFSKKPKYFKYFDIQVNEILRDYKIIGLTIEREILPYGDIVEAIEFRKQIIKSIEHEPENPYYHANLGVIYVQNHEFKKALEEFNIAERLFQSAELNNELNVLSTYILLTRNTLELITYLKKWDKKFLSCLEIDDINILIEKVTESTNDLSSIYNIFNEKALGHDARDLINVKMKCVNVFSKILRSQEIVITDLNSAKDILKNWDYYDFLIAVNTIENLYYQAKIHGSINEYFKSKKKEISISFSNVKMLNGKLTLKITDSLDFNLITKSTSLSENMEDSNDINYDKDYCLKVCEELSKRIPIFRGKSILPSDYIEFLNQFPKKFRNLMAKILKDIIFFTFKNLLNLLVYEINKFSSQDHIYFILFDAFMAKSSSAWSYFTANYSGRTYKTIKPNEIIETLKNIRPEERAVFIILDDVVGTGNQLIETIEEELSKDLDEIIKIITTNENIDITLIIGIGTYASRENFLKSLRNHTINQPLFHRNDIRYGQFLDEDHKAFHLNKFISAEIVQLEGLKNYLENLDSKWWHGYQESQMLVVLEWNSPNNTIGCLWNKRNNWNPLFPRIIQ